MRRIQSVMAVKIQIGHKGGLDSYQPNLNNRKTSIERSNRHLQPCVPRLQIKRILPQLTRRDKLLAFQRDLWINFYGFPRENVAGQ